MTPDDQLAHLRRDAERMVDLARVGDLEAAVPACPAWTVRTVLGHTGTVYSWASTAQRLGRRPERPEWLHGPGDDDPVEWFQERHSDLVGELVARGPDEPTWTWYPPDQTAGFWYRRMAHETAVHRVDVESAHDAVSAVGDALAVDGIDEVLDCFLRHLHEDVGADAPGRGTVAVRTGEHVWRQTLTADAADLSREPGAADAVVSGEPSELLLWLWGRRPDAAVQVEGDTDLVAAFRERLRRTTQ